MRAKDIENNDALYRFLLLYYLEDLSSPLYEEEILNSPNPRETIYKYITAWAESDEKVQAYMKKYFADEP